MFTKVNAFYLFRKLATGGHRELGKFLFIANNKRRVCLEEEWRKRFISSSLGKTMPTFSLLMEWRDEVAE